MIKMFRKIKNKKTQKDFCTDLIKQFEKKNGYEYWLKHYDKKTWRSSFIFVSIYDVLDNDGFKKLINSIYNLKKHKKMYDVDTNYLNHRFSNVNYIKSNYTCTTFGRIATIKLNQNEWIAEIDIAYTYCNFSEIIVEYRFRFKKAINSSILIHRFVMSELKGAKKEFYFFALSHKRLMLFNTNKDLSDYDDILFTDILQSYICKFFYTKYGRKYPLPTEFCMAIHKYNKKIKRRINNTFFCSCYEREGKDEHLVVNEISFERKIYYHIAKGKFYPNPILRHFFGEYSMEMYYQAFKDIEMSELEIHMRKYLNSQKKIISSKDIKWLINKLRFIREQRDRISEKLKQEKKYNVNSTDAWNLFINGKKQKDEYFIMFPNMMDEFEKIYINHMEYIKAISSTQNDKIILIVSVLALIATIIGIIVTIII